MRPTAFRRNARGLRDRQAFEGVRMQAGALFAAGHPKPRSPAPSEWPGKTSAAGAPSGKRADQKGCAAPAPPGPPAAVG
jgi:hypothetical protein